MEKYIFRRACFILTIATHIVHIMASNTRDPKQWQLSKNETLNSFTNWKENLFYTLSLDSNFSPFLLNGFS